MRAKHAGKSLRPRRTALIAAIGALAIFAGIQGADALSGDGSSASSAEYADPTPSPADATGGPELPLEPEYAPVDPAPVMTAAGADAAPAAATALVPALSGEGWKSLVKGYLPTGYTIRFRDQRAVNWLGPQVRSIAAQMAQATGLRYTVDTTPVAATYQLQKGDVLVNLYKRPCKYVSGTGISSYYTGVSDGTGEAGFSCGFTRTDTAGIVQFGHVWINTEHFGAAETATTVTLAPGTKNLLAHELGHSMGLMHANNSETAGDCAKGTDAGQLPVMCRPSTAYQDAAAGRYVQQFDLQGLRAVARNNNAPVPAEGAVIGIGGKCLDVKGGKSAEGTQIQLWQCHGGWSQRWIFNADGTITAFGKCLDNYAQRNVNGNKIQLHSCNGTAAQKWRQDDQGRIVNTGTGKVLDVDGSKTANGTIVQLWTPHTGANQKWTIPRVAYRASIPSPTLP